MEKITLHTILLLIFCGCEQEESLPIVGDPKQAILGKWEVIENTYGPIRYPGSYREFRLDSVLFDYNDENDFSYSEYWFADSLWVDGSLWYAGSVLYIKHTYIDQVYGDTILVDIQPYQYDFLNYNKLQLTHLYPFMNPVVVYKRLN